MPDHSSASRRACKWALVVCLAAVSGCATGAGPGLRAGERAETARNYDLAVVEYTKALRANPDDDNARLALERAKLRASQHHAFRGRTLASEERYEEALGEYQVASELNPSDALVNEALRDVRQKLRTKIAVTRNGKTELMPPGRYDCKVAKVNGEWLFRHRLVVLDGEAKLDGI